MLSRPNPRALRRVSVSGLAVTAALGLAVAGAAPAAAGPVAKPAGAAAVERVAGPLMNYAVNATAANRGQTLKVERAVRAAGGSVVASYAEIGVVIASTSASSKSSSSSSGESGAANSAGSTAESGSSPSS